MALGCWALEQHQPVSDGPRLMAEDAGPPRRHIHQHSKQEAARCGREQV